MFAEYFCQSVWTMKMREDHQRFATRVLEAFVAAGNHTDTEVKDAGGPSSTFMTSLRRAARGDSELASVRTDTLRRIDAAAHWVEGSARSLWLWQDEPVPLDADHSRTADDPVLSRVLDLEERVDVLEREVRLQGARLPTPSDAEVLDDLLGTGPEPTPDEVPGDAGATDTASA